ncbi:MAG: polyprenyl diphosphate synthase [Patescibacteria group bacterium]|nr:polyprenyl diphosphate synthase [Patescibacteria group bacterium]
MIGAEQRGGIVPTHDGSPKSRGIWERFPELGKIPNDRFPKNVFIVPDGNGRWAAAKRLAIQAGHERGSEVIVQAYRDLNELSEVIPYVGVWGFSIDNLKRSPQEVSYLMNLFDRTVKKVYPDLVKNNSRFVHIGRKDIFDQYPSLGRTMAEVESDTKGNTGQVLYIAIGFSGEDQELRIAQKLAEAVKANPNLEVTTELLHSLRDGEGLIPSADLVIRTSGERRLSGLGWIAEGSELCFPNRLFPACTTKDFVRELVDFSKRDRRFGGRPTS